MNTIKLFFIPILAMLLMASCAKDETRVVYEGGVAPVLTSTTEVVDMSFNNADKTGLILRWTNPTYKFNTGTSSQTVNYLLEIDTVGSNFTNPNKKVISLTGNLDYPMKVSELNDIMLNQLGLTAGQEHNLEMRIISYIDNTVTRLTSNVIQVKATPYNIPPKIEVPTAGTLWIVGDAVPSNWSNPLPAPYDVSQMFTMVSPTVYELVVEFVGGGGYKLIQEQGVWGSQYHMTEGTWSEGDFEQKDSDPQFPGPPDAGMYKITVDFQRGKYFVTKL